MSDKALSSAELELTQRFQVYFPHGEVPKETLRRWNSRPKEEISAFLKDALQREPRESDVEGPLLTLWDLYTPPAPPPSAEFFFPDFIRKLKEKDPRAFVMDHNFEEWFLDYREIFDVGERQVLLAHRVNRPHPIDGELSRELGGRQYSHCALRHAAYVASSMNPLGGTYVFRVFDCNRILRVVKVMAYQSSSPRSAHVAYHFSAATYEGNKEYFRPGDFVVTMMIPD